MIDVSNTRAKSIGEIVINTPAPALAQAIANATGIWFKDLPITSEQIAMGVLEKELDKKNILEKYIVKLLAIRRKSYYNIG